LYHQNLLFIAFAMRYEGYRPYTGWIFVYDPQVPIRLIGVYCTAPINQLPQKGGGGGGIWQSGAGPAADDQAIYFLTGNGDVQPDTHFSADHPANMGQSFVRMSVPLEGKPATFDVFHPIGGLPKDVGNPFVCDGWSSHFLEFLAAFDLDMASDGPLLLQGT